MMSPQTRQQDIGITTVQTYADGLSRDHSVVVENNNNAQTRLVWFVAIAGFALLNIDKLAETIVGTNLTKLQLVLLVIPWAIVGVCGVVAHWLLGELTVKDNEYYIIKQHVIRAWLATTIVKPKIDDVLRIINIDTKDKEVSSRNKEVAKFTPTVRNWENATFIFLIFSFIWSVFFPLLIGLFS